MRTSAAIAHAVVATGLTDARRLAAWRADPSLLADLGVPSSTLDLAALADFAGMSEKVRHNPCRDDLALTFRLLLVSGLEIEFFRAYAPVSLHRRRLGLNSTMDRIVGLAEFAEEWADDPTRGLLRDVIAHERVLAELRRGSPAVVVRTWTCDPRQVADVLHARSPDLDRIARGSWTFAYQKRVDGLRMFETDKAVGDLLMALDGETSIDVLADRFEVERDVLTAAVGQLVALGLLEAPRCG